MQSTTPTDEKPSPHRTATDDSVTDITVYHDVGLDTDGRAYFLDEAAHEIVVTDTDRRGRGIRDSDKVATIALDDNTVAQYCQFVRDESGREWAECSWLEEI